MKSSLRFHPIRLGLMIVAGIFLCLAFYHLRWRGRFWLLLGACLFTAVFCIRWLWKKSRQPSRSKALSFTGRGKIMVGLSLAVGFAALNTGANLLFLVLGFCLSLILASGFLSERNLRQLSLSRKKPDAFYAGRVSYITLEIQNPKKGASYGVQLCDHLTSSRNLTFDRRCAFLKIAAQSSTHSEYAFEPPHRGLYRLGPIELSTRFPFSFFLKLIRRPIEEEILVYPRVEPSELPIAGRPDLFGQASVHQMGPEGDFYSLRDYLPGDPLKAIHWKQFARQGILCVRENERPSSPAYALVLNDRRQTEDLEAEDRLIDRCASLCALLCKQARVTVTCSQFSCVVEPEGAGLELVLSRLALLSFTEGSSWTYSGPPAIGLSLPHLESLASGPITWDKAP